ncbi:hypothetical protein [Veronia pacifica]|uniref:hypothetical protein n=1 Tax=Veronia pacifica TaxID=1080227 RepID=UPI0015869074|nr:hypothetical protein [Veronia pacifica]
MIIFTKNVFDLVVSEMSENRLLDQNDELLHMLINESKQCQKVQLLNNIESET